MTSYSQSECFISVWHSWWLNFGQMRTSKPKLLLICSVLLAAIKINYLVKRSIFPEQVSTTLSSVSADVTMVSTGSRTSSTGATFSSWESIRTSLWASSSATSTRTPSGSSRTEQVKDVAFDWCKNNMIRAKQPSLMLSDKSLDDSNVEKR